MMNDENKGSATGIRLILVGVIGIAGAGLFFFNRGGAEKKETTGPRDVRLDPAKAVDTQLPTQVKQEWDKLDDPNKDGWPTEMAAKEADKTLKKLSHAITTPADRSTESLSALVTTDFRCSDLVPSKLSKTTVADITTVERAGDLQTAPDKHQCADGLALALKNLLAPLEDATDIRCKFKVFRIQKTDGDFETRQYVSVNGRKNDNIVGQNATWDIEWTEAGQELRMRSIAVLDFEQVQFQNTLSQFEDVTASAIGANKCYTEQFLFGLNHWFGRIQDERYFNLLGTGGLAVGDVNGDGLADLYVTQEEGLPNRLFLQQPDGTAKECAKEWHVDWSHNSRGTLLCDLDNDGDQDLVIAMVGHLILLANTGKKFEVRKILQTDDDTMSLSAADYDLDGDLDLYVCVYFKKEQLEGNNESASVIGAVGGASSGDVAGRNSLFRNDIEENAEWNFVEVTKETGLDVKNFSYSLAASWDDFDNDGDQDLYVANDYGLNNLYRNDGGKFIDVANTLKAADRAFGMSVAWGDYDRNGSMDLYIANMFSSAGGRITSQLSGKKSDELRRFARGNTLLKNQGDGSFFDVSVQSGVTLGRWAWGSNFIDINNDGWEDLVVANGFLTTEDTGDL